MSADTENEWRNRAIAPYGLLQHRSYTDADRVSKRPTMAQDAAVGGIKWCPGAELNHRHSDFQSLALPTELPGHCPALRPGSAGL